MNEINKPNEPSLLDHNYDGIQEYDNPLPNWWLATFLGTIIFGFIYYLHYEISGAPTLQDELKVEMSVLDAKASQAKAAAPVESEEALAAAMAGADAAGKAVFIGKCAACHGDHGQGMIGPNLADNFWIHGKGQRKDILAVVRQGVPDKGMPGWDGLLKPDEIIAVAGFVYSLKGSHPANPKAPQGTEVK